MRQPFSVQVFLYRENNKKIEYLLFKRVPRPELDLPAFWQGISGGLEEGEKFDEAVIREVFEESGINITNYKKTGFVTTYPIKDT